jgi:hypothetical protein
VAQGESGSLLLVSAPPWPLSAAVVATVTASERISSARSGVYTFEDLGFLIFLKKLKMRVDILFHL